VRVIDYPHVGDGCDGADAGYPRPVLTEVLELVVAPALVAGSTLAAHRWGHRVGGVVSAFPAIVGPVLLIAALDHGAAFAAKAASGTLLGLVALSGFAVAYAWTARRAGWGASLAAGWIAAALIATALSPVDAGPLVGVTAAALALGLAHRALPATAGPPPVAVLPRWELPLRIVLTAVLVITLTAAAGRFGPVVGGLLAALPVLASILAVFTHDRHGAAALAALLRGMLSGMAGFAVFCLLVAVLVTRVGITVAFVAAALTALAAQALSVAADSGWGDGAPASEGSVAA
jgi:hypothetical protein